MRKHNAHTIVAGYNADLYNDPGYFLRRADAAVAALLPHTDKFEVIAFRGSSGAMFAPYVAARLGKHIVHARKNDGHHEAGSFTGMLGMKTYVIIDDLVATGTTLRTIQDMIHEASPVSKCVAFYLWTYDQLTFAGSDDYETRYFQKYEDTKE